MSNYPVNYAPPEGEELPVQQKKIRCRQCGGRAYENLVICPNCGRELHPAAPRWLVWGAPALIVLLFLLVLTGVGGGNPINAVRSGFERSWAAIVAFGDKIEPRITVGGSGNVEMAPPINEQLNEQQSSAPVAMIPAAENLPVDSVAVITVPVESVSLENPAAAQEVMSSGEEVVTGSTPAAEQAEDAAGEPAVVVDTPTDTPEATATATATPEPPTPLPTATATVPSTPVAVATLAPTEAATAQRASSSESSSSGATSLTVSNIRATSVALTKTVVAASSPTTTPTPLATNTLAPTQTNLPTNTPSLPTATATASATSSPTALPTATATAEAVTYTIQGGDTLLQIAQRNGTTVTELMEINGMSDEDVRRLRVGQVIRLPSTSQRASAPASAAPQPTASTYVIKAGDLPATIAQAFGITVEELLAANNLSRQDVTRLRIGQVLIIPAAGQSSGATPSGAAAVTSSNYRLDAPILRSPESGTPMSCSASDSLVWNTVPFMAPADQYVLHLGFVSNVAQNGDQTVTWILELIREQSRTSWDLDSDYCALAPQEWGRQWRWYVQVIDENGNPVSPPSDTWAFSWN